MLDRPSQWALSLQSEESRLGRQNRRIEMKKVTIIFMSILCLFTCAPSYSMLQYQPDPPAAESPRSSSNKTDVIVSAVFFAAVTWFCFKIHQRNEARRHATEQLIEGKI
jgi:hypothetical protein